MQQHLSGQSNNPYRSGLYADDPHDEFLLLYRCYTVRHYRKAIDWYNIQTRAEAICTQL